MLVFGIPRAPVRMSALPNPSPLRFGSRVLRSHLLERNAALRGLWSSGYAFLWRMWQVALWEPLVSIVKRGKGHRPTSESCREAGSLSYVRHYEESERAMIKYVSLGRAEWVG